MKSENFLISLACRERHKNFADHAMPCLYFSLVAIFVSAGAAGIPSAGLSYTILCYEAVGVPARFIGLIFAVDWIV